MRRSFSKTKNNRIALYSFLLSLILNLSLLLVLSILREKVDQEVRDAIGVNFVSLPKERPERRSLDLPPKQMTVSATRDMKPDTTRVKSILVEREMDSPRSESVIPMSISPSNTPDTPTTAVRIRKSGVSPLSSPVGKTESKSGVPFGAQGVPEGRPGAIGRGIVPRQPMAGISGKGDELSGYYNISLVQYEDTSDTISTDALRQLAGAMNRWTEIRTKVIKEPIALDDSELLRVPMVYITSRRAFAFSEKERENLRKYLTGGGFLMFSNAATSESDKSGVDNSIEFELWKVLDGSSYNLVELDEENEIYGSFFDLPGSLNLSGVNLDGRFSVIYEDSGYGAGWVAGKDGKREPYLKLGVNIIAYALTTSPLVVK